MLEQEIQGQLYKNKEFTYIEARGNSIIDYAITNIEAREKIDRLIKIWKKEQNRIIIKECLRKWRIRKINRNQKGRNVFSQEWKRQKLKIYDRNTRHLRKQEHKIFKNYRYIQNYLINFGAVWNKIKIFVGCAIAKLEYWNIQTNCRDQKQHRNNLIVRNVYIERKINLSN